jgi:S1-C subfamily serine protease
VVEHADKIRVKFKNGKEYDAKVTGTDPKSDVAVIEIKPMIFLLYLWEILPGWRWVNGLWR